MCCVMFIALLWFLEVYPRRNGADCPLVCLLGTFPATAGKTIFAQSPVRTQPTNWPGTAYFREARPNFDASPGVFSWHSLEQGQLSRSLCYAKCVSPFARAARPPLRAKRFPCAGRRNK